MQRYVYTQQFVRPTLTPLYVILAIFGKFVVYNKSLGVKNNESELFSRFRKPKKYKQVKELLFIVATIKAMFTIIIASKNKKNKNKDQCR